MFFQWVPDSPSGFRDDGDWCSLCRKRLQGAADAGGTLDAAGHGLKDQAGAERDGMKESGGGFHRSCPGGDLIPISRFER